MVPPEDFLASMPEVNLPRPVTSYKEVQRDIRSQVAFNGLQRVDCIAGSVRVDLVPRSMETLVIGNRQLDHLETIFRPCHDGLVAFVRWFTGWYENDLFELECFQSRLGQNQMSNMNRAESSAENADSSRRSHSSLQSLSNLAVAEDHKFLRGQAP